MDIVLEKAGTVAGVEIKAAATVVKKDFRGLKKLLATIRGMTINGTKSYAKDFTPQPLVCVR